MHRRFPPSWTSRLVGLALAIGAVALTVLNEWNGQTTGEFSLLGAFWGPSFAVVGMGLALLPGHEQEMEGSEAILGIPLSALLSPPSWSLLALLAGFANVGHLTGLL